MTYGEMLLYGGIALVAVGFMMLIVGSIVFSIKRKTLKKKLYDRYGF